MDYLSSKSVEEQLCNSLNWLYISPNQYIMKTGDVVRSTGKGKTKSWGNYMGIITRIENEKVFVQWNNTSFEDEMILDEVELIENLHEVTQLKFSDGMIIHTQGPLRVVQFSDGWYVVGEGKLIPVRDEEEGLKTIIFNTLDFSS